MKIFNNLNILNKYKRSSLAIGNFDGVHKGHQKVFKYAKKFSKKINSNFGILTFSPLPVMFFNKKIKNYRVTSEEEKLKLLKKNGVDYKHILMKQDLIDLYHKILTDKNDHIICNICTDPFLVRKDKIYELTCCKQIIHKHCLDEWCKYKSDCPYCRCKIPNNLNK